MTFNPSAISFVLIALTIGCGNSDQAFDTTIPTAKSEVASVQKLTGKYTWQGQFDENSEDLCPDTVTLAAANGMQLTTSQGLSSETYALGKIYLCISEDQVEHRNLMCEDDEPFAGWVDLVIKGNTLIRTRYYAFDEYSVESTFEFRGNEVKLTEKISGADYPVCYERTFEVARAAN